MITFTIIDVIYHFGYEIEHFTALLDAKATNSGGDQGENMYAAISTKSHAISS